MSWFMYVGRWQYSITIELVPLNSDHSVPQCHLLPPNVLHFKSLPSPPVTKRLLPTFMVLGPIPFAETPGPALGPWVLEPGVAKPV